MQTIKMAIKTRDSNGTRVLAVLEYDLEDGSDEQLKDRATALALAFMAVNHPREDAFVIGFQLP